MNLEQALNDIRGANNTKTAAEAPKTASAKPGVSREALLAAVNDALPAQNEKTASVNAGASPAGDLAKIASEINAAESALAEKEARLLGAAFADSAMERVAQWNAAIAATPVKMAAAPPAQSYVSGYAKFASEQPDTIKQAMAEGWEIGNAIVQKVAADAYARGYNDTLNGVAKLAHAEFVKSAALTKNLIDASRAAQAR